MDIFIIKKALLFMLCHIIFIMLTIKRNIILFLLYIIITINVPLMVPLMVHSTTINVLD